MRAPFRSGLAPRLRLPEAPPTGATYRWDFDGGEAWRLWPGSRTLVSPPLQLDVAERGGFAHAQSRCGHHGVAVLGHRRFGSQALSFEVPASADFRVCDIELQGESAWRGAIVAIGIEAAAESGFAVKSLEITENPLGPADVRVLHFGFENGVNRAERDCLVAAHFVNDGGTASEPVEARLVLPDGLSLVEGDAVQTLPALAFRQRATFSWTVRRSCPARPDRPRFSGERARGRPVPVLRCLRPAGAAMDYVPEPRPVKTAVDVRVLFPGLADVKWNPVRFVDPIRKPLLGYYDEGKPEVVDWQIKWAVENGITGFRRLVLVRRKPASDALA